MAKAVRGRAKRGRGGAHLRRSVRFAALRGWTCASAKTGTRSDDSRPIVASIVPMRSDVFLFPASSPHQRAGAPAGASSGASAAGELVLLKLEKASP